MEKGKYLVTFLFLIIVPFISGPFVLEPANVPRFLAVCVILCFVFIRWIFCKPALIFPPVYLCLLLGAYYLINLASFSWSLNKADAIYESQRVFLVPALLVVFLNWLNGAGEEEDLIKTMIIIAFLYLAYAVLQIIGLPDLSTSSLYQVQSFAENKNMLASFLFLLCAFLICGIILLKGAWRGLSTLLLFLSVPMLIFLRVRSVYLALGATAFLLLFFGLKQFNIGRRKLLIGAAVLLVLCAGTLFINPEIARSLNVSSYRSSESGNERLIVWSKTLGLIRAHPLLGVGANNWQYNYSKEGVADLRNVSINEISFQRPHNDLLWIFSETGIIGSVLIFLILLYVLKKTYPLLRAGHLKTIVLFSFLAGLLVESFFSFPKERIGHIVLASLMLALLLKQSGVLLPTESKRSGVILMLLFLPLILSVVVGLYRIKGEHYTRLLLSEKENSRAREAIDHGNRAISCFYLCDPTSTPIYSYIGWGYMLLGKTDSLLYTSKKAYEIAPYDHEVLSNYGYALDRNGKRIDALAILSEALRINPYYEPARLNMAITEYNLRHYEKALEFLLSIPDGAKKYELYYQKILGKLDKKEAF